MAETFNDMLRQYPNKVSQQYQDNLAALALIKLQRERDESEVA